jgi:hypothetical protein
MRRAPAALVFLAITAIAPENAGAQQPVRRDPPAAPAPCDGVRCSRHGACVSEDAQAYCFCDEGYRAESLTCVPAPAIQRRTVSTVDGTRIVEVALAEEGRRLEQVGALRVEAPGPLSRWVSGTLWCSDFVSWVYRVAGVPFSGGYGDGRGWHLTSNTTIRTWYQRRHAWVDHDTDAWPTFRPRAGDYVRISTPTWGHSAIVRYVEGSTLYTVEGNASGRVVTTRYRDFRAHPRIDGFGMTTMADARIAATRAQGDDTLR